MTPQDKLLTLRGHTLAQMHNMVYRLEAIGATGDDLTDIMIKRVELAASMPSAIEKALNKINIVLGTNYQRTHYYNWMSGQVKTPGTVRNVMMRDIFIWLFGQKAATDFKGFWQ